MQSSLLSRPGRSDVSTENDGTSKLEGDGGFGGPLRKERTHEAVKILGRADRLRLHAPLAIKIASSPGPRNVKLS